MSYIISPIGICERATKTAITMSELEEGRHDTLDDVDSGRCEFHPVVRCLSRSRSAEQNNQAYQLPQVHDRLKVLIISSTSVLKSENKHKQNLMKQELLLECKYHHKKENHACLSHPKCPDFLSLLLATEESGRARRALAEYFL